MVQPTTRPVVVNKGCILDEGSSGYNTESLIADHSG
jgi:hypothetical protein